ncbi:MAG: sugar phosphate isomerase/epimerase family protein [Anaerolineales bacterium]
MSCLPVSFFSEIIDGQMSVLDWATMASAAGLDGLDISILFVPDRSPARLAALRSDIESAGMRITMVTSYPDFTHPNPAQREKELQLEQQVVETAAALGASLVRVTAGQAHPEIDRQQGIEWAVEGLCKLQESVQGSGVTLVYENHSKPGVWEYTDFSEPPDIFLEIARATAGVGLGINFDAGNAATFADDPCELLRAVMPRVVSVHASDSSTRGKLNHVLLGTGITPYPALFRDLKQAGWEGWICMEEASFQGRQGLDSAARFIRETWDAS